MALSKRKRTHEKDEDDAAFSLDDGVSESDSDVDISSALVGKKPRLQQSDHEEDDEELQEIIRQSISKRNKKGGTDMLKKTKGKTKITKGEVGGGSFQNMGAFTNLNCFVLKYNKDYV